MWEATHHCSLGRPDKGQDTVKKRRIVEYVSKEVLLTAGPGDSLGINGNTTNGPIQSSGGYHCHTITCQLKEIRIIQNTPSIMF